MPNISQSEIPRPKSWDEFEDIVADLYARTWGVTAERYGRSGQAQQGVDVYGCPAHLNGGYAGIQCKRYEDDTLTKAKVEEEIAKAEKFKPPLAEYIIATTEHRDAKLQKAVREITEARKAAGKFPVSIVFWEDLCSQLAHSDNIDLLKKHYSDWLRIFAPLLTSLHQLPPPPGDFTGRADELAKLTAAVETGGAVICGLRGMGGVGKTVLALKLAQQLAPRYPNAQFYLNLQGTTQPLTPAEAMAHIIRSYHPTAQLPESKAELSAIYRSVLYEQRAILLLDNAANRAQVEPLLPSPTCLLLVTSRQHFALPDLRFLNLDQLPPADARALLLKIADRLEDNGSTDDCADKIAKLCGYLPLALRLAGSALAERIDIDPADYLGQLRDAQTRLSLVDASLSLSYNLLDTELQHLWCLLSVFPAAFDRAAVSAVWETDDAPAQDALSSLVGYSLIEWNPATSRYTLHDLVRLFVESRLGADDRNAAQRRHAAHYIDILRVANELYLQGGESIERGLTLFDLEWSNIQAGQTWAAEHLPKDKAAAHLCNDYPDAGRYCLNLRLHSYEWIQWLETALDAARKLGHRTAEEAHLGNLGSAYRALGQVEKAIQYYAQSLVIAREVCDRRIEGKALGNLGSAYRALGRVEKAIQCHRWALIISREIGDRRDEAADLGNLGNAYSDLGQVEKAIQYCEQALTIAREIGDRRNEGNQVGNLGNAYYSLGQVEKAITHYEQALTIACEIGDRRNEGNQTGNLGNAYRDLGQMGKAIQYYERALVIAHEIDDQIGGGIHSWNLGLLYEESDPARAAELMQVRVDYERGIGHPDAEAHARRVQSLLASLAG